jgi:hypothetical protein
MLPQVHQYRVAQADVDDLRGRAQEAGTVVFENLRDAATFALAMHLGEMSSLTYMILSTRRHTEMGIERVEVVCGENVDPPDPTDITAHNVNVYLAPGGPTDGDYDN